MRGGGRWTRCRAQWARLYSALERGGEALDAVDAALEHAGDDPRDHADDLQKQVRIYMQNIAHSQIVILITNYIIFNKLLFYTVSLKTIFHLIYNVQISSQ
jgi:hypothetical protein